MSFSPHQNLTASMTLCNYPIRVLWQQGKYSVHDMRVVNTDALTHRKKDSENCFHEAERCKHKMYLEACLLNRRHFSPIFASVDGLMGVERAATLKSLASNLVTKWKQSYSKTGGYVKSRISTTAAYEDPECRHTRSVYSGPSGRMAQGSTSFGKHARSAPTKPIPLTSHSPKYTYPSPSPTKSGAVRQQNKAATDSEKGGQVTPAPPGEKDTLTPI